MAVLQCDIPASFISELTRRANTNGATVSKTVSDALAGYLDAPLHTLFQVSTSGSLIEGVYSEAVTCAQILQHGDFGLGTFTDLDGEMVVLDGAIWASGSNGTRSSIQAQKAPRPGLTEAVTL